MRTPSVRYAVPALPDALTTHPDATVAATTGGPGSPASPSPKTPRWARRACTLVYCCAVVGAPTQPGCGRPADPPVEAIATAEEPATPPNTERRAAPTASSTIAAALATPPDLGPARCPDFETDHFGALLGLRVFLAQDVPESAVAPQLSGLAGYFAPYGIRFRLMRQPRRLERRTLIEKGPPRTALAPLRAFLAAHARGGQPAEPGRHRATHHVDAVLNVVFVGGIAPHAMTYFARLDGLAIGDHLLRRADPLATQLDLEPGTLPTMLLSRGTDPTSAGPPPLTAAHELGHLLGLEHAPDDRPEDLMAQGAHDCVPGLQPSQRTRIRETLARWQP